MAVRSSAQNVINSCSVNRSKGGVSGIRPLCSAQIVTSRDAISSEAQEQSWCRQPPGRSQAPVRAARAADGQGGASEAVKHGMECLSRSEEGKAAITMPAPGVPPPAVQTGSNDVDAVRGTRCSPERTRLTSWPKPGAVDVIRSRSRCVEAGLVVRRELGCRKAGHAEQTRIGDRRAACPVSVAT